MGINLPFFKNKSKKILGLDIGSYNLKAIEVTKTEKENLITAVALKDIRDDKDLSEAIKQIVIENKITAKETNISLSGESVVARHLSMPKMSEEEIKKAITFKLEDHIPFKPEDVYLDFHILGEEFNSKNKLRVFLVATKKDVLDARIQIIKKAGLIPKIVTMDTLAIMNTLYFNYPDKLQSNIMLLNVGDKISNLIIVREKTPYFVRDTRFGGEAITALLQSKLQLNKKAAEELKYSLKDSSSETARIIKTTIATLLNEIFVSVDFFENLTEQKIEEVYISGGCSQLFGLKDFLSGYLGITLADLNPLQKFSVSKDIPRDTLIKLSPYLSVAAGLTLEEG